MSCLGGVYLWKTETAKIKHKWLMYVLIPHSFIYLFIKSSILFINVDMFYSCVYVLLSLCIFHVFPNLFISVFYFYISWSISASLGHQWPVLRQVDRHSGSPLLYQGDYSPGLRPGLMFYGESIFSFFGCSLAALPQLSVVYRLCE